MSKLVNESSLGDGWGAGRAESAGRGEGEGSHSSTSELSSSGSGVSSSSSKDAAVVYSSGKMSPRNGKKSLACISKLYLKKKTLKAQFNRSLKKVPYITVITILTLQPLYNRTAFWISEHSKYDNSS